MQAVEIAIGELRRVASEDKRDNRVQGTVDRIAEYLRLLKSPSPPVSSIGKLSLVLRKPLLPLYVSFPQQTLCLSASVLVAIFEEKISSKATLGNPKILERIRLWETVQTEIISGILDFLEANETVKTRELIAAALYQKLCDLYLPPFDTTPPYEPHTLLRTAVYTLLHETAASTQANQQKLRDSLVLGSKRLGLALACTTEYLALEALLTLFARLLPSTVGKSESGRANRMEFIHDVTQIMSDQGIGRIEEIIKALDFTPLTPWEETSVKIIEILSDNISFPQPFHVDSIRVGATTFPQPLPEDRLYIDQKSFFANVDQGNVFETFQALYSQVTDIKLALDPNSRRPFYVNVTINLSSPPLVGNSPMSYSGGQPLSMTFGVQSKDVKRFLNALRDRGLSRQIVQKPKKMSKADSSTILDFGGTFQDEAPAPSAEDKFRTVEQYINDLCSEGHISSDPPATDLCVAVADVRYSPPTEMKKVAPDLLQRSMSQVHRDAVFGTSDEELSDISEGEGAAKKTSFKNPDLLPVANHARTGAKKSLITGDTFEILSTLPAKSAAQGLPKRKKMIILDSDGDSDDLSNLGLQSGNRVPQLSTTVPASSSSKTGLHLLEITGPAVTTQSNMKAAGVERSGTVSDNSEPETCFSSTEPVLIDRSSFAGQARPLDTAGKRLDKFVGRTGEEKTGEFPNQKTRDTQSLKVAFKEDDPVHATKRKREAAELHTDSGAPLLDLTSRKRLRQNQADDRTASSPHELTINVPTQAQEPYDEQIITSAIPPTLNDIDTQQQPREPGLAESPSVPHKGGTKARINKRKTIFDKSRTISNRSRTSSMKGKGSRTHPTTRTAKHEENNVVALTRSGRRTSRTGQPSGYDEKLRQSLGPVLLPPGLDKNVTKLDPQGPLTNSSGRENEMDYVQDFDASISRAVLAHETKMKIIPNTEAPLRSSRKSTIPLEHCSPNGDDPCIESAPDHYGGTMIEDSSSSMKDIVTVDLTKDDVPATTIPKGVYPKDGLSKHAGTHSSPVSVTPGRYSNKLSSPLQSPVTRRVHYSVTFAPPRESISPINIEDDFHRKKNRSQIDVPRLDPKRSSATSSHKGHKKTNDNSDHFRVIGKNNHSWAKNSGPSVQDIVEVLDKIHKAITQRVTGKLEYIKANVQNGRTVILDEAASDLHDMCSQSAEHFNSLVDLEDEYGMSCRKLVDAIEDVSRTNVHIRQQLLQTIQTSDRNTLSKKLPNSLFTTSIDDEFHEFVLA